MGKLTQLGFIGSVIGAMALFTIPIMVLNTLGGIISGMWLMILGEWWALGYGFGLLLFSIFGLSFLLLPGLLIGAPTIYFLSKRMPVLAYPFAFLSSLYTVGVITGWCIWVLHLYLQHADSRSFFPLLLWSYGTATGPWTWMASKEQDNFASLISATAAQIGYIVIMVMVAFFRPTFLDVITGFGGVMLVALAGC